MKIQYSYMDYPDCPKATEYSRDSNAATAKLSMLSGWLSIAAIICYFGVTIPFSGDFNWLDFFAGILLINISSLFNFYVFRVRLEYTEMKTKIIVLQETVHDSISLKLNSMLIKDIRKEYKKTIREAAGMYFSLFYVLLIGTTSLIVIIKSIYFLCNEKDGIILFLCLLLCSALVFIISLIIFVLLLIIRSKGSFHIIRSKKHKNLKPSHSELQNTKEKPNSVEPHNNQDYQTLAHNETESNDTIHSENLYNDLEELFIDSYTDVLKTINDTVGKYISDNVEFELFAVMYTISDFIAFKTNKDRQQVSKTVIRAAQQAKCGIFAMSTNQLNSRQDLYAQFFRGKYAHALFTFGEVDQSNGLFRVVWAFGDILNNPDMAEDYETAPLLIREFSEQIDFAEAFMTQIAPAIVKYCNEIILRWDNQSKERR